MLEFTSHPYEGTLFDEDDNPVEFKGWRTDFLTERAIEFMSRPTDEPFYLMVSYLEPHFQNDMKRFVAPDGYAERYANCPVPPDLRSEPGDWGLELGDYYGLCAKLDENLGQILACLDERGLTGDTIVAFTSDHGCHFRTRNSEYKRSCHESSIRIPLVFQGPLFDRRLVVPEPVSLVDVPATLLAAAGMDVPPVMQGRSMLGLLDRQVDDWPEEAFFEISEAEVGRGIRTDRWKYSVFAPEADPRKDARADTYIERYLYDLYADPYEQVNLVGRAQFRQ
ncbi:hypothetical protein LCGC14_3107340, partial [marine sediment metagenome]